MRTVVKPRERGCKLGRAGVSCLLWLQVSYHFNRNLVSTQRGEVCPLLCVLHCASLWDKLSSPLYWGLTQRLLISSDQRQFSFGEVKGHLGSLKRRIRLFKILVSNVDPSGFFTEGIKGAVDTIF